MTDAERCYDLGCADPVHVAMGSHEARPMTEPRTKAGRKLRDYLRDSFVYEADDTEALDVSDRILAIEREVAAPALDVDRLADFILGKIESPDYQGLHPELASMGLAIALRDEYARLSDSAPPIAPLGEE